MTKPMSRMLLFVSIFFILVFGWYGVKKLLFIYFMSHYQTPPVTIAAQPVTKKTWQPYITAVGTLYAMNGVEVSADVAGIINEINFTSGQYVKKGNLLLTMRAEVESANLKFNEAKLQLAKINHEREQTLFKKKVSSQALLDTRYAELQEAQANVEAIKAQIQQKMIVAPFDGKLGIKQVNVGQYLSPGVPIVTLQSLDPLYVTFSLPEKNVADIKVGQHIEVALNFTNEKKVHGKITAINAKVDPVTRNILIQGMIANPDQTLYPGMYGLVKIWLDERQALLIVPQTAVAYSLSGDYVFVLKKDKESETLQAYRQNVKVGERRGDEVAILSGLSPDETIVTAGQLKLQNGTKVLVDNKVEL